MFVSEQDEVDYVTVLYGKDSTALKVMRWTHSKKVQVSLAVLLLFDVVAVVAELLIDGHYPSCSVVLDRSTCHNDTQRARLLNGEVSQVGDGCVIVCEAIPESVETAHKALFIISIVILGIFAVELVILLSIMRLHFFRHLLYMIDFIIVITALVLEIALHNSDDATALSLIVFARIWRLLRLGHGIFTDTREFQKAENEELLERIQQLETELSNSEPREESSLVV